MGSLCLAGGLWLGTAVLHLELQWENLDLKGIADWAHTAIDLGLDLGRFLQNQRREQGVR